MISFDDFKKLELKVGIIKDAEPIEDADRLLKLSVDIGEEEPRQIVAGIADHVNDVEELSGMQVAVLSNLKPKEMFGVESQGMVLAASGDEAMTLLTPADPMPEGTPIQ